MWTCPNCDRADYVYHAGAWCASCGWHAVRMTLHHANFAPDVDGCQWCARPARDEHGEA